MSLGSPPAIHRMVVAGHACSTWNPVGLVKKGQCGEGVARLAVRAARAPWGRPTEGGEGGEGWRGAARLAARGSAAPRQERGGSLAGAGTITSRAPFHVERARALLRSSPCAVPIQGPSELSARLLDPKGDKGLSGPMALRGTATVRGEGGAFRPSLLEGSSPGFSSAGACADTSPDLVNGVRRSVPGRGPGRAAPPPMRSTVDSRRHS
jgi:hypothetical protein